MGTDTAWSYDGSISAQEAQTLLKQSGWDGVSPLLGVAVIDPFCWPVRASLLRWLRGLVTGNWAGRYDRWYFFSDSPARRKAYDRYLSQLSAAVSRFCKVHGCFPVLIGMERLDAKACGALAKRLGIPSAMVLSGEHPASEMVGVLRQLSLLVTSRYHAAVLSMAAEIPIAAVSMDERLDGLLRELSMEKDYLFSVSDPHLGQHLTRAMEQGWAERSAIARHIHVQYQEYLERLSRMGAFLKKYITGRLP